MKVKCIFMWDYLEWIVVQLIFFGKTNKNHYAMCLKKIFGKTNKFYAGYGYVLRNHEGRVLKAGARPLWNIISAEAMAIWQGYYRSSRILASPSRSGYRLPEAGIATSANTKKLILTWWHHGRITKNGHTIALLCV